MNLPSPHHLQSAGIQPERVQHLNDTPANASGRYVLYWMQASQRSRENHALEYAIRCANENGLPVVTVFGLTDSYPNANARHYRFLLQGLAETERALDKRGIRLVVLHDAPPDAALRLANNATLVVTDRGYARIEQAWRAHAAGILPCALIQVEANAVVPVETASTKAEYAARTLRPRIHRQRERFLIPLKHAKPKHDSMGLRLENGLNLSDIPTIEASMTLDRTVLPVESVLGGEEQARKRLRAFITRQLATYDHDRNDPALAGTSRLSPYLHFGQIAPLTIALAAQKAISHGSIPQGDGDAFLEQLIVRRELSLNLLTWNEGYDEYARTVPAWARKTLAEHTDERREYDYTEDDLARAQTHDPYWNAAQTEMIRTGFMHNYMRMYWGKKVLEWHADPAEAHRRLVRLNDRYELDGRDANGYANIAWCFGTFDRPWPEKHAFGKVRSMGAKGLERKFDIQAYVARVNSLPNPPR